jgi:hypothetical protein
LTFLQIALRAAIVFTACERGGRVAELTNVELATLERSGEISVVNKD